MAQSAYFHEDGFIELIMLKEGDVIEHPDVGRTTVTEVDFKNEQVKFTEGRPLTFGENGDNQVRTVYEDEDPTEGETAKE